MFFQFQNNKKNIDPSKNTDLDLLTCFEEKENISYNRKLCYLSVLVYR